ncbi:uncharacterized protein LOC134194330 [Corticium candelabrum]|uniref:uncharacterized protein LOC134194330 n=1 Tax=Corticium candelabrum TaxID=121492 RepID=UPI002E2646BC|nr:uncharacterized protein LOC134194330 [Corticium candelabrum]
MKNKWWLQKAEQLQLAADQHNSSGFYQGLKEVFGPSVKTIAPLQSVDNSRLLYGRREILTRLGQHFESILNHPTFISQEAIDSIDEQPDLVVACEPPSSNEINKAIRKMSRNRSPGADGLPAEIFQHGGELLLFKLGDFIRLCWELEDVPQNFKDANIIHLYKKKSQCGFRSGRGTSDMIFSARQLQEKCREQHMDLFMVFIDLVKAFESVDRTGLWKVLLRLGCPVKIVNLIKAFHTGMMACVVEATDLALNKGDVSAVFNIDNRQPIVTMPVGGALLPDRYTQANQSTFTFQADENNVRFTCKLNSGNPVSCVGIQTYGNDQNPQAEGDYIFYLTATDEALNSQTQFTVLNADGSKTTRTSYVWTVDRTPPNRPDITFQPQNPSSNSNPRFRFSPPVAEIGGVTYLCQIKRPSSSFTDFPCTDDTVVATSTSVVPGAVNGRLGTGPHTLRVRMKDGAGNVGVFNEFNWIIDLIPPVIYNSSNFASPPDTLTKLPDKNFRFFSSDDYVYQLGVLHNTFETRNRNPCPSQYCSYECNLDGSSWVSCRSPHAVTDVVDKGKREVHTFYVRPVDDAGNRGAATSFTWEIDRIDVTVLWQTRPDVIDNDVAELFVWSTTENYLDEPPTFMCEVDVRGARPCGLNYDRNGQYNFTATGLTHGHHDFYLTPIDYVGNVAPRLKYSWTTDLVPPVIYYTPNWGPPKYTNSRTVKFVFSTETHAELECRLDAGNVTVQDYEKCSVRISTVANEVNTYVYSGLPDDEYTFYARSIDQGGNISPNISYIFTVDTVGPAVSFSAHPNRYTNKLSATFVLNASEILSTFECQYISDRYQGIGSIWLPCSAQPFFAGVINSQGDVQFTVDQFKDQSGNRIIYIDKPHVLKARATDRAGNTGPESSWIWEIDLLPPNLNFSNADNDKNIGITNQNFRWVNETSIVLDFAALESTYQCHIQQYSVAMKKFFNVTVEDCQPPYLFTNYSGLFRVKVVAFDYFGNTAAVSENGNGYVFGIAGTGPSSQIVSGPANVVNSLSTKFTVNIPFPRAGARCSIRRLDSLVEKLWQCIPIDQNQQTKEIPGFQEISFDISTYVNAVEGKFDGHYVFKYAVVDFWNNVSPEKRYDWTVDVSPPKTALRGTYPEFTQETNITFEFFSDEDTVQRFECKLDKIVFGRNLERRCAAGGKLTTTPCSYTACDFVYGYQGNTSYSKLTDGFYEFSVRAKDIGNNVDATPATVQFTVDTQPPEVKFLGVFPESKPSIQDSVKIYFQGEIGSQSFCRIAQQFGVTSVDFNYETCQSPYIVKPADPGVQTGGSLVVALRSIDKAGNVYETQETVFQGAGEDYPSFSNRLKDHENKTLAHLPQTCPDNDDIFAALAIAGFALFAILAVVFPLVIMSRMSSGSPTKFNRQSQKNDEGVAAFSKRPLEEDFY